jgi:hypothetical protein
MAPMQQERIREDSRSLPVIFCEKLRESKISFFPLRFPSLLHNFLADVDWGFGTTSAAFDHQLDLKIIGILLFVIFTFDNSIFSDQYI